MLRGRRGGRWARSSTDRARSTTSSWATRRGCFLPDIGRLRAAEGRFRALRLVHTHLHGEALTRDDLVDLVRLRLDLVAAVQLQPDGEPRGIVYAYNTPPPSSPPYREVGPVAPHQLDVDFGKLMSSLEAEFAKSQRLNKVEAKDGRAILV